MSEEKKLSRETFINGAATVLGSVVILGKAGKAFAQSSKKAGKYVLSKGYAAKNKSGKLSKWSFERRELGDDDVLIDIKFSGICHSDIHQMRGHWGPQQYPQVPGHEIAGVVISVGKNVTKFKTGDHAGVGCMVDSCGTCESCKAGEEQHCDNNATLFTYGYPDKTSPSGITQGGYSSNIVVKEHFVIRIPKSMRLQDAAPLLCAGITTYSPLVKSNLKKGDKVGIAGIGGLGHIAIKLAVAKGVEVYAFTTTKSKVEDILSFGAKEAIYVDSLEKLKAYNKTLDYMISTIPYNYNLGAYASLVKPYGSFTQVGVPVGGELTLNNFAFIFNRVNYNGSLIGGIPQTQEIVDFCAKNKIYPQIELITANEINQAWEKVVNKEARYRFVIDTSTI
ncbi:NAD(P)-dependent alcohol dehydrogenase [Leptospira ilyithenensis]|uniref:NAD(P)-dependent alcohol dehydrogenase n=1 Tax=Leptospira ilyithenensis TaxID=2484901 RepID=A0A4R9LRF3_9LEPT|nr:NAD(P)-dependent alcohol dehydrogenase [Leptospira ilyithenensis]TGN13387.1 NAD(P)-dependent alcohol dehydrogenase [Leptospira ilyithenensis]